MKAAELFPVGTYINEELEARGWTQATLAAESELDAETLANVISGAMPVDQRVAEGIGAAFGTSASVWAALDSGHRVWLMSNDTDIDPANEMSNELAEFCGQSGLDSTDPRWHLMFHWAAATLLGAAMFDAVLEGKYVPFWDDEKKDVMFRKKGEPTA